MAWNGRRGCNNRRGRDESRPYDMSSPLFPIPHVRAGLVMSSPLFPVPPSAPVRSCRDRRFFVRAMFPCARFRRGAIHRAQNGGWCAVGGTGCDGCGVAWNWRRGCNNRRGRDESRPYMGVPPPASAPIRSCCVRRFFVRAAFALSRCSVGAIYRAQNGCRCAVADDRSHGGCGRCVVALIDNETGLAKIRGMKAQNLLPENDCEVEP